VRKTKIGFGEEPPALYTTEPRQILSRDQTLRFDSLLDFTPNDEAAAFQWSQNWWKASGLASAVDELPKGDSIKEFAAAWGILDSNLEGAESRRKDFRKSESKNRRKIRLLNEDYFIPSDGGYPGLRKLIDAKLDPTFGEELDPNKRDSLHTPTQPSDGNLGSGKFKGSSKISEQDEFVGAVGEYMAFCAIHKMTNKRISSIAWKSENRKLFVDDGEEGNDSLGYDFRFRWNGQVYEIEVKSSKNKTPQQVRLGPTEVRRGQECAGKRKLKAQWQIWLVTDVLAAPSVHLLGNPYANDEQANFVIDALGARVSFHLGYRRYEL